MNDLLGIYRQGAAPAPDFDQIRELRNQATTLDAQRLLALQERNAYARDYVQRNPVRGTLAMLALAPAEQVYKGVNHLVGREVGRSGFFDPLANIGAAYQGILEGWATK